MSTKTNKFLRGSEWRKWDLHVHSLNTHLDNGYNGAIVENFVKAVTDKQLNVVGLTNYFNFSQEDFTLKNKLEEKDVTVFLNLEIRLAYQNKEDDCCDAHIVFDNRVTKNDIENFLTKLNVTDRGTEKIAKNLSAKEEFEKATVEFDHLIETLNQESLNLAGKYLIGFLSRGKGNSRSSTNYEKIAKKSHFLIHSSDKVENVEEDRNFWLTKNKPLLQSSDAHKLDDIGSKFTWIKADTTFEGFKQTLYEPKTRVLIQERNPSDPKTGRLVIDRVTYKTSARDQKTVYFNKDLNSIIGKRGSGKSTLLKNLAQKIDQNEFSKRDKKSPYQLDAFEVVWGDNQKDGGTDESPKSIFYIPQGYLSALAYDDGERANERDVFLTQLLKKNERFANAIKSFENFVSKNRVHIEELIQKLLAANTTIKENEVLLKKQGTKAEIEKEVKKKNDQIKKYKGSGITDEEVKEYSKAQKAADDGKKEIDVLSQDKEILASIKKTGASIFISDQEFSLLSATRQELIQKELQKKSKESLKALIDKEIIKIDTQIKDLNKIITDNEKIVKKSEGKIKKSKALEGLTKELSVLENTIDNIKKLTDKITQAKKERVESVNALAKAYSDFESQQASIYKTIEFKERFSFLKVEIVARYNTQQLKNFVERNINTRDSNPSIKTEEDIRTLFGDSPTKLSLETVKKLIEGLIDEKIKIKVEAGDLGAVLAQSLGNRFEIDYLNSVKTKDGQTQFKNMTGGQKAIALLELIFRFDDEKYPILIDQPEDDLDVGGIASDLVNFIDGEKQERQIIIVTHNASLVICADTENNITSEIQSLGSSKYDFSYATGSIENPDRRTDVINVLEGGEDALRKRMLKLNIR